MRMDSRWDRNRPSGSCNLPQVLALVTEHHGAVVWVVLLDEDVTIEAAHVLDTEDTNRTE